VEETKGKWILLALLLTSLGGPVSALAETGSSVDASGDTDAVVVNPDGQAPATSTSTSTTPADTTPVSTLTSGEQILVSPTWSVLSMRLRILEGDLLRLSDREFTLTNDCKLILGPVLSTTHLNMATRAMRALQLRNMVRPAASTNSSYLHSNSIPGGARIVLGINPNDPDLELRGVKDPDGSYEGTVTTGPLRWAGSINGGGNQFRLTASQGIQIYDQPVNQDTRLAVRLVQDFALLDPQVGLRALSFGTGMAVSMDFQINSPFGRILSIGAAASPELYIRHGIRGSARGLLTIELSQ